MNKQDDKVWLQGLLEKHDETRAALSSYNKAEEAKKTDPTEGAWNVNAGLSGVNQGLKGWNPAFGLLTGSTKFGAGLMATSAALMAAPGVAWQKATGGDVKNAWGYNQAKASFAQAEEGVRAAEFLQTDEAERVAQSQLAPDFQKRQGESAEMALARSKGYARPGEQGTFQNMRKTSSEMAGTAIFPVSGIEEAGASVFGKLAPISEKIGAKLGGDAALNSASKVLPALAARPGVVGATTRAVGWAAKQSLEGANIGTQFSGLTGNDPVEGAIGGALLQPVFALGGKALASTYRGAKGVVNGATDMAMGVKDLAAARAPGKPGKSAANWFEQQSTDVNKGDALAFQKDHGQSIHDFKLETGLTTRNEELAAEAYQRHIDSMKAVDTAMEGIEGTFKNEDLSTMARESAKRANSTATKTGPDAAAAARLNELAEKAQKEGLTMPETNEVKRFYEKNVKTGYVQQNLSEKVQRAKNLDTAVRNFQVEQAEKAGFGNLRDMNKQTQKYRALADAVGKRAMAKSESPAMTFTDWISAAVDPKVALAKIASRHFDVWGKVAGVGAKTAQKFGSGPAVKPDIRPNMESIGKQSSITEAKAQFAKQAADAAAAKAQLQQDALKGPLFQQGPTGPKAAQGARAQFREGMGPSGEAADPRAALLSGLDRSGARPAAQPRPGQTVTSNEAPGFFGYQDAKVMGETPALTDPHQRAAAALLGNKPSLPLLTNGAPRLPDRAAPTAEAPRGPVTPAPSAPEAPKLTFGKKAEPAAPAAPTPATPAAPTTKLSFGPKKTAEQLQSEIDAIGEQIGASHSSAMAAPLRAKMAALQDERRTAMLNKLTGGKAGGTAQGTTAPKAPTPEEQARIDRIKASMAPKPAAPNPTEPKTSEQKAQEFRKGLGNKPEGGQPAPVAPEAPKAPQTPAATHLAEVLEGKPTTAPADTKAALGELKAKFDENVKKPDNNYDKGVFDRFSSLKDSKDWNESAAKITSENPLRIEEIPDTAKLSDMPGTNNITFKTPKSKYTVRKATNGNGEDIFWLQGETIKTGRQFKTMAGVKKFVVGNDKKFVSIGEAINKTFGAEVVKQPKAAAVAKPVKEAPQKFAKDFLDNYDKNADAWKKTDGNNMTTGMKELNDAYPDITREQFDALDAAYKKRTTPLFEDYGIDAFVETNRRKFAKLDAKGDSAKERAFGIAAAKLLGPGPAALLIKKLTETLKSKE